MPSRYLRVCRYLWLPKTRLEYRWSTGRPGRNPDGWDLRNYRRYNGGEVRSLALARSLARIPAASLTSRLFFAAWTTFYARTGRVILRGRVETNQVTRTLIARRPSNRPCKTLSREIRVFFNLVFRTLGACESRIFNQISVIEWNEIIPYLFEVSAIISRYFRRLTYIRSRVCD